MKWLLILCALCTASCAKQPQETGFLTTYSNLKPESSTVLLYIAADDALGRYNSFIVDPITVKFYDQGDANAITSKQLSELQVYFQETIRRQISDRYQIVTEPGPQVAVIRIAITDLKSSTPALNVLPQTALLGLGLGGASVEAEVLDSQTKKQIAATVRAQQADRFQLANLSDWAGVQAILDTWAKELRARLDQAHDKQTN